jgi:hypothetical protein
MRSTEKAKQPAQSAIVCFLQLVVSPIWSKSFLFGPLEWVWRCLAYLHREPLRQSLAAVGETYDGLLLQLIASAVRRAEPSGHLTPQAGRGFDISKRRSMG